MEPISTIATGYLVTAIKENPELKKFGNDFLGAFVQWIRPLFLKDDATEKEALHTYQTHNSTGDNVVNKVG